MTESTHISLLDIDLEAAAAAFGSGGEKPAEKGNEDGALENVDLTITAAGMDFPGALALINGLTFEAMHPELVTTSVPDAEEELPDWLKSGLDEPESQAQLPEEQVEPIAGTDGPTAEEAEAGLAAAAEAGTGTQVLDGEEVVIPPARESYRREAPISVDGMKKAFRNYLSTWLDRNKLSLAAEFTGGTAAGFLANLCFTELIAKNPQMASFLPSVLTSLQGPTIISTNLMEAGTIGLLNFRGKSGLAEKYMRASSYAERIAVSYTADNSVDRFLLMGLTVPKTMRDAVIRPGTTGFTAGTWLYATLAGAGVFGEDHQLINGADAVGSAGTGDGEGFGDQPPVAQPVPEADQGNVLPPGGEIPTENLLPQPGNAELLAQQAAEAARQAALDTAATTVGITGQELAGGTIWGNELEFVKQLGVHHVEPVTNLLKNFSKVLAQAQPPTEIGPTDTAYVINRDVAGWAAGQADKLYGMDPSSMTSWQKALWEIGRGLREANWRDLQAVTEEFVRQAKP